MDKGGSKMSTLVHSRGGGGGLFPPFVHVDKERGYVNVHACPLEGGGGQNWVKFGPRSC